MYLFPLYCPEQLLVVSPAIQSFGIGLFLIWIINNQKSKFIKVWNVAPLRYIGKISYGLYIYQGLFLGTGAGGKILIQQFPLNIGLTIVAAILSFEFYEKRILKLKKKFV